MEGRKKGQARGWPNPQHFKGATKNQQVGGGNSLSHLTQPLIKVFVPPPPPPQPPSPHRPPPGRLSGEKKYFHLSFLEFLAFFLLLFIHANPFSLSFHLFFLSFLLSLLIPEFKLSCTFIISFFLLYFVFLLACISE